MTAAGYSLIKQCTCEATTKVLLLKRTPREKKWQWNKSRPFFSGVFLLFCVRFLSINFSLCLHFFFSHQFSSQYQSEYKVKFTITSRWKSAFRNVYGFSMFDVNCSVENISSVCLCVSMEMKGVVFDFGVYE